MKTKKKHNKKYVFHILYFCLFLYNTPECFTQNSLKIKNSTNNDVKVKEFGLQLSKSFASGNDIVFLNALQPKEFFKKVILENLENKNLTKFNVNFKLDYLEKIKSFPNELINALKNGDFYNFVSYNFDPIDKTYHLIFRYYSESFGLDYHDYRLMTNGSELIIDDIFIYTSCQKLSETLKLYYLSEVPKKNISNITTSSNYDFILMLKNYVDAKNSKQLEKAYKHISILNKALKNKDRFTAMLKLELSSSIGEEAYFETMEDVLKYFKSDPSINLTALRYHYLNKDYDAVFKSINNIENHTHDTFLDFEKGNLSYAAKNYESAVVFYTNMIENYPFFHLPKFSLLVIYEKNKEFKKATELLNVIIKTSSYSKRTITKKVKEQLPLLSNSSEFKIWCKK